MPKITPNAIKCAFFLYRTVADAEAGRDPCGTGFLVGQNGKALSRYGWETHVYAVTNWHVAVDDGDPGEPPAPIVRLNRRDGSPCVVPLALDDWRYVPGLDLAAAALDLDFKEVDALCIPVGMLLSEDRMQTLEIGVGEDVFMMGLFVDHDGGPTNVPAARFGNISVMPSPNAPIPCGGLPAVEGFVLDMHSRTGFSGSPVFVYRTFGSDLAVPVTEQLRVDLEYDSFSRGSVRESGQVTGVRLSTEHRTVFELLGVHCGQFYEEYPSKAVGEFDGPSAMTCVIPAWRVRELLNLEEFVKMRDKRDTEFAKKAKSRAKPEKSTPPKAEPQGDREAFKRLLGAAVKSPKSSG